MGKWIDEQIKNGKLTAKMLYDKFGFDDVVGIVRYGHKAIAGPTYFVGITIPVNYDWELKPANKLSIENCCYLDSTIRREALWYRLAWNLPITEDRLGVKDANRLAFTTLLSHISIFNTCNLILVDGTEVSQYPTGTVSAGIPIIKISRKSSAVCDILCAANIVARSARSAAMQIYHEMYPMYEWNENMGLPTDRHLKLIEEYGLSGLHYEDRLNRVLHQSTIPFEGYIENYYFG